MAAGPVEDAGGFTTCPSCGKEVRQKAMIPVLRAIVATGYICRDCARAGLGSDPQNPAASEPAIRSTSSGSAGTPTR